MSMHPRNPYRLAPDFSELAEYFPPLKPFVSLSASGKSSINFQDSLAQRTLTQALLKRDFHITLSLPENRLCPAVPNRLNYILWIQDILFPFGKSESNSPIRGLDIGTGASAIYPILACSLSREWDFVGTEIDSLSASFASQNVEANNLSSRIKIWTINPPPSPSTESTILVPLIEEPESIYDFTMCNPPFYSSASEIESSAESKELPPNAVCTGAETEMITPGGETAFVLQMVRESARDYVKRRCRWYTSMLGKLSSVGTVVEELRKLKIHNYALTQFVQGTTRRWAVGWSFSDECLPDTIARPASSSLSSYIPAPTALQRSFTSPSHWPDDPPDGGTTFHDVIRLTLFQVLSSIDGLTFHECGDHGSDGMCTFDVQAMENTWSRAARRKRKRSRSPSLGRVSKAPRLDSTTSHPIPSSTPTLSLSTNAAIASRAALHCRIKVLDRTSDQLSDVDSGASPSVVLMIQWVRGMDRALFEGFWSHVCRKVKDKLL